jgi:tight adherence protein B
MTIILGLSYALGLLSIFSYLKYPETTFDLSKRFLLAKSPRIQKSQAHVWPDLVDDLASSIRAGLSLPQAMLNLAQTGPESLRANIAQAMSRYQMTGDFVGSLNLLSDNMKDPVVDKFTSALQIAYEVGGTDLGFLLRSLSEVIREDNKIRGEIEARQSWTINGARLAIAAPWLTVVILSTRQSAASVYFSSQGVKLLTFCAVMSFFAYFAMTQIGKLPTAKRIKS